MTAMTRREMLCAMATIITSAAPAIAWAQHAGMGPVKPPLRLTEASLVDQTCKTRTLAELLSDRVTAVQTIYTGCSSICPLQGALFGAVQDWLLQAHAHYPIRLLSIGIDPYADEPSALREWLARFHARPLWNAATPVPNAVERVRAELAGRSSLPRSITDHSTQVYYFDESARLRWRSADLPRVEEVCNVLSSLARLQDM
jgi:protein SCO1/2